MAFRKAWRQVVSLAVLLVLSCTLTGSASTLQPVRFSIDWIWQGVYAPYLVGVHTGFYADEGLAVTLDRGFGSADTAGRIAAGLYDMGVVDLATLVEFNSRNPGNELMAVAVIYNFSPLSVMTLRDTGIQTPKDLEGRRIAAPAGAAARSLFPAFAKVTGVDAAKVEWITVAPPLREPMLIRREADATAAFLDAILTLEQAGVPEEDVVVFHYPAYGLELYGLAVVTRPNVIAERPGTVRGMVRAIIRSWLWSIENPDRMIDILLEKDPLVDPQIEKERFLLAVERLVLTEEVWANGIGYASEGRLLRHIDIVTQTLGLPRTIPLELLFTAEFLPPLDERLPRR